VPLTPDDISRGYATMLGRAPESEAAIDAHIRKSADAHEFYGALRNSDEFFIRSTSPGLFHSLTMNDLAFLRGFADAERRPVAGCIVDFVGSATDCRFVAALAKADGQVEGIPRPANFHSKAGEWIGCLRSVGEARDRFVMVELGAGWGPWLAVCGIAARRRGVADISLIGVEGDAGHFGFLEEHLRRNGFDPAEHDLRRAIVAARSGVALFPIPASPAADYGLAPLDLADEAAIAMFFERNPQASRADYARVAAVTPAELFAAHARIDLVHIDIQGGEADLLEAAMADFTARVRRVVVGTHGRSIEERLHKAFGDAGWRLEHDDPCRMAIVAGRPLLAQDGAQVWLNPGSGAP
jgi:FkbM family methyltransferase